MKNNNKPGFPAGFIYSISITSDGRTANTLSFTLQSIMYNPVNFPNAGNNNVLPHK
jgi:hypothetical protein